LHLLVAPEMSGNGTLNASWSCRSLHCKIAVHGPQTASRLL
jgi:hypothetical protein